MKVSIGWVLAIVLAGAVAPAAAQSGIQVVINGSPVSLAAPVFMQSGQLMIPAIRVFESFGSAALWQPAERTISITNRTGLVIRLRIGDQVAQVNGQPRPLPTPAILIGNQPFVPAYPVFMMLGAWVRFDEPSRTLHVASQITGITIRRGDGAIRVVLDATGPLRSETRSLTNPDRLVVDLHGGAFRLADQDLPVGEAGVIRVRAGQFQVKPYVTRIVFDLQQQVDAKTVAAADTFAFTIEVRPRGSPLLVQGPPTGPAAVPHAPPTPGPAPTQAPPPSSGSPPGVASPPPADTAPSPPQPDEPPPEIAPEPQGTPGPSAPAAAEPAPDDGTPRITQVRVEQTGARLRVIIEGTMPLEYSVREFVYPDRVTVDVARAVFVPIKQNIPVAGTNVTEVRAAQFQADPAVTRIVVVLRQKVPYVVSPGAGGVNTIVIDIPEASVRAHVVAIDAGHGGKDTGAIGPTGLLEKDVVLDIAQRVRELLVKAGVQVIMTRETDTFVELPDRPRLARQQGATVFVSIHANASTRQASNGSETYYLTPQSLELAQLVQEELARVPNLVPRGTKTANFLVLRESDVPAVLVEVAYVSNPDEEARLRQQNFRERLAEAVARGVQRFLAVYPVPAN
jgi:N-acetylmuramoyl-L-alanine amidase